MTEIFQKKSYSSGAEKHLEGKLRVDLIPPEMITALATGLGYGCSKYSERNWEKGIPLVSSYASALRHLLSWVSGTDIDEESGIRHIILALLNIGFIVTQTERGRKDLDDRVISESDKHSSIETEESINIIDESEGNNKLEKIEALEARIRFYSRNIAWIENQISAIRCTKP